MFRLLLCMFFLALTFGLAHGADIYVPDDQPTIQDAINAAVDGDTIIIRPGTYFEYIDFATKSITLKSEKGPYATTIDGGLSGYSVVDFPAGGSAGAVLEGFTITNGNGQKGGGIHCANSDVTITDNIIIGNEGGEGGGIYCDKCSPRITRNLILNNRTTDFEGGGGGILSIEQAPTITDNYIFGNQAYYGGGIRLEDCQAVVSRNKITQNSARAYGGGIEIFGSDVTVTNCIIKRNRANGMGGGGIFCNSDSNARIVNCTLFDNSAFGQGGGIFCYKGSMMYVANTILWSNYGSQGPEIAVSSGGSPSMVTISYSDLQGGQAAVWVLWSCILNWGPGMIDATPLFANPAGGGDYHLTFNSPCKNAGYPVVILPSVDFEGDPRTADGAPDIGADEFHPHLYYHGSVVPGSYLSIRIVGEPGAGVVLAKGSGVRYPPAQTPYGLLHLQPPFVRINLPPIPADGIRLYPAYVPTYWSCGEKHPFQALVWGSTPTLTNLMELQVE